MSLGVAQSLAMHGLNATVVTVEAHCGTGLPTIHIVGKADTAVREAGDRVRSAFHTSGLPWPRQRLTLSLSPADIPKTGAHFDLAIALAILASQGHLPALADAGERLAVVGEVGLDGRIIPIRGVLPMAAAAARAGITTLIVPTANQQEASLVEGLEVLAAEHLTTLVQALRGEFPREHLCSSTDLPGEACTTASDMAPPVDFAEIRGQREAVEAALIAAAGAHHLLMLGPPGAGKSMIAQRLPTILPPLSDVHALEVTAVHSLCGALNPDHPLITQPPYQAPHPGISSAALLGGGSGLAKPGALSLAHRGILFLDECTEIPASTLDLLRTPLQEGEVRISRSKGTVTYPARCQLVLAGNPCPCGAPSPQDCRCSSAVRARYRARLSGPLLDRVDLRVRVQPVGMGILTEARGASSSELRERVIEARARAGERWGATYTNSDAPQSLVDNFPLPAAALRPVHAELRAGQLSARGLARTIRVAWTLADLTGSAQPTATHIAQAVRLRCPLDDV